VQGIPLVRRSVDWAVGDERASGSSTSVSSRSTWPPSSKPPTKRLDHRRAGRCTPSAAL